MYFALFAGKFLKYTAEIFFTVDSHYKYEEGVLIMKTTGSFSHRDMSANYKEDLTVSGIR